MNIKTKKGRSRKWLAVMCIPLAFLLTSCIKLDMALTVNKDKTVSGSVILGIADSLASLGSSTGSSGTPTTGGLDGLINKKAKGVTVSKYHADGFTGEKVTFDHSPLSAFSSSAQKDGSFAVDIKGNQAFISGSLDLSSTGTDSSATSPTDAALAKAMFAGAQVRVTVTFPGKITKSTGEISKDGRTATWNPTIGEKTDLATTVALDSPMNFIPWAIGGVLLLGLIAWLIFINRKKTPMESSSTESETPPTESEGGEIHSI